MTEENLASDQENEEVLSEGQADHQKETKASGDKEIFLDPIDSEFCCDSCDRFLYSPFTMKACKHSLCSSCYSKSLKVDMKCPIDGEVIEKGIPQNKKILKKISKLRIKCPHSEKTCEWEGILLDLTKHSAECLYQVISCSLGCSLEYERQYEKEHSDNDCKKREIQCKLCEETMKAEDEEEHIKDVCVKFMIPCPNGCSVKEIARSDFDKHIEEECDKQQRPCPYAIHGCEEMGLIDKINSHVKSSTDSHIQLMNKTVVEMHKLLIVQTAELVDAKAKLIKIQNGMNDILKANGCSFIWRINEYNDKLLQAKTGKRLTFFSEPFYSHQLGYRFGVSICPNGDGKMSGKYFSVFVCIYKGEYDSLLPWPFASSIKITMIDQNPIISERKSIEYTIRPNVIEENDMFLQRPKGERNPSFGALRFCALDEIENGHFIMDNTMYLKITVDGEEIPLF